MIARRIASLDGVATHVSQLTRHLNTKGVEVTVLAVDVMDGKDGRIDRRWIRPFLEFRNPLNPRNLLIPALSLIKAITTLQLNNPIDIIHVHDSMAFFAVKLVAALFGIPTVFTVHSLYVERPETSPYPQRVTKIYRAANRFALNHATRVFCVSSDTLQTASRLVTNPHRLQMVPNFINLGSIRRYAGDSLSSVETCLFVGSLSKIKGVDHLLKAVPDVLAIRPRASFVIIGDGPERLRLKVLADNLNIGSKVQFVGAVPREDTGDWYTKARLMVVPSLNEAQGIVVLEAFAHGLPVVASNVGGIPDMVKNGWNGLLVLPGDSDSLAKSICQLLENDKLWKQCSTNAIQTAQQYSWEKGISQIIELYKQLSLTK